MQTLKRMFNWNQNGQDIKLSNIFREKRKMIVWGSSSALPNLFIKAPFTSAKYGANFSTLIAFAVFFKAFCLFALTAFLYFLMVDP